MNKQHKILVVIWGFLGDALLSQPIAKKLKSEGQATHVDFMVGFPHTKLLLEQNPYINRVILPSHFNPTPNPEHIDHLYDEVRVVRKYKGREPLTIEHQVSAKVQHPTLEYVVYTLPEHDSWAKQEMRKLDSRPIVGISNSWKVDSSSYYDPTPLALLLSKDYNVILIGHKSGVTLSNIIDLGQPSETFSFTASKCKHLDLMLGSEGGLTNLAAGVGCPIIYSTDFIYNLAGPKGFNHHHQDPTKLLGPKAYFKDAPHVQLPSEILPEDYLTTFPIQVKKFFDKNGVSNNRYKK